jgi:glucose/arabinose dehydrogenase
VVEESTFKERRMPDRNRWPRNAALILAAAAAFGTAAIVRADPAILTGAAAFGDWTEDAPGTRRHITAADLPAPYTTQSATNHGHIVPRPKGAMPQAPPGFTVSEFAAGLSAPRLLRVAPNGDIFVAETDEGDIRVFHAGAKGRKAAAAVYAKDLDGPFGLAFYPPGPHPQYLYVATAGAVQRFAYRRGDRGARGKPETIVAKLPTGGHSTRDVLFSPDGKKMYVSVGSASNVQDGLWGSEKRRAEILEFSPDGGGERPFATGLRNPVAMAIHPLTGDLWTVVNERDGLGDNLPPDYATRVRDGAFYGWPWYYIGAHQDPRHQGAHPELRGKITVPDVLLQPHSAPLGLAVYTGKQFPTAYRNDIFVALHGSWNRARRTGYKVVRAILHDGRPTGEYEDFLTGFVTKEGDVWARPVGVAVAPDGALLVSDDAGGTIWRIAYTGAR